MPLEWVAKWFVSSLWRLFYIFDVCLFPLLVLQTHNTFTAVVWQDYVVPLPIYILILVESQILKLSITTTAVTCCHSGKGSQNLQYPFCSSIFLQNMIQWQPLKILLLARNSLIVESSEDLCEYIIKIFGAAIVIRYLGHVPLIIW